MKSIQDSEVKPKAQLESFAAASLPAGLFLMPSALGLGKLGVYTTQNIEGRVVFGPFKGEKIAIREISAETDCCNSWDVSFHILCCFILRSIHFFVHVTILAYIQPDPN